ncbi:MAG: hypothetical protein ABSG68_08675 [Thermoguttaceae bacterium]|jgi:hypothetical protein
MKTIRAKFKLTKIEITEGSKPKVYANGNPVMNKRGYQESESCEMRTIVMNPVYGNRDLSDENTKFWQASPGGELRLNVVNLAAVQHMVIGREYYLDITEAECITEAE